MFGDYDIIETVGQGGMGIVYRAKDTSLGREVALKVLKDDLRSHKSVAARFQREAQAYATLNHPNIVHIYSVGAVGQIPFIAMELVKGMPLSQLMKQERRLDWKRSLAIGIQIAEALGSAHEAHIIHRDIKPGNVLLTNDDHAFVTDFGIAKILTAETQLTLEGSRLGTPQYMSPERCQNAEITASSDLYSLGVLLFQMISGRLPYESKDTVELIRKIVKDPPTRLSEVVPDIPDDVERLIAYLLEKKPEDRPLSAQEWVELCQRVIDGKPLIENDSGLENSLKSFRESMPTPTPLSRSTLTPLGQSSLPAWIKGPQKWWKRLSPNSKTFLLASAIALVAGLAGYEYERSNRPDSAPEFVKRISVTPTNWRNGEPIATFMVDRPGVRLIQLSNPDWMPTPLEVLDASTSLVAFHGREGSEWEGRQGLIRMSDSTSESTFVLNATALESLSLLGRNPSTRNVYFKVQTPSILNADWYSTNLAPQSSSMKPESPYTLLGRPASESFATISEIAFTDDQVVVAGQDLNSESWGIYQFDIGRAIGTPIAETQYEILHHALAQDGRQLAYTVADDNNAISLHTIQLDAATRVPLSLTSLLLNERSFALHPSRNLVAVVLSNESGEKEAILLDSSTGETIRSLGTASDIQWHPDGEALIVLRSDRKGVKQAWIMPIEATGTASQVTFFADGLANLGVQSVDLNRMLAISGSQHNPALVLIDFDELR